MAQALRMKFRTQGTITAVVALLFVLLAAVSAEAAQDQYGAIAYSPSSGTHGYSYDYTSRSMAQTRALNECNARTGRNDCRVAIWFKNACGALAVAPNGAYGSGWGTNVSYAKNYAKNSCGQYGNNCQVTRWVCTSR